MDSWMKMLAPIINVRMPCSGNLLMNYHPWTNWGLFDVDEEAGDPEMDVALFRQVALPGKQLGKLNDAVMALIELSERPDLGATSKQQEAFADLKKLAGKISAKKHELQDTVEGDARRSLLRLRRADRTAFNALIDEESQRRKSEQSGEANDS